MERNDTRANIGRKILALLMTSAQVAEAEKLAQAWIAKHKKK